MNSLEKRKLVIRKSINYNSATIAYTSLGEGKPVVLLHGFGEDSRVFESLSNQLSKAYKVIMIDFVGSGKSSGLIGRTTLRDLAEDVVQVLSHENIHSCTLLGHSMGGYVALEICANSPDRISAVGLLHSSVYGDSEEKQAARDKNVEFLKRNGTRMFLEQSIPGLFSEETKRSKPELISSFIEQYTNFSAESLVQYTLAMKSRPDHSGTVSRFRKPVLFIIGEYDTAVPLETSLRQTYLPELAHVHICTRSGHMGMLEEPDFVNNAVESFLSAI
jgi:pimeloyl-ACP methyl ester carboxylesterase